MSSLSTSFRTFPVPIRSEQDQKFISTDQQKYYIEWALEVLRCLLKSGVNGEWRDSEQHQRQQAFDPTSDELILLRSPEGSVKDLRRPNGDAIFNKYRQHSYMSLLRPKAFLIPANCAQQEHHHHQQQQDKIRSDEKEINHYELNTDSKFSFVLFIGWRKPDLSASPELWNVEDGLMEDLMKDDTKSIHYYCVLPLADGINYVNIVIGRELKVEETPINLMGRSMFHQRAVMNASPEAYDWVRIHGGQIQFFNNKNDNHLPLPLSSSIHGVVNIRRTLCVDFGKSMPPKLSPEILHRLLAERNNVNINDQATNNQNHDGEVNDQRPISPITEGHPFSTSFSIAVSKTAAEKLAARSSDNQNNNDNQNNDNNNCACPYARRGVLNRYVESKHIILEF